jgi:hypothetical protein
MPRLGAAATAAADAAAAAVDIGRPPPPPPAPPAGLPPCWPRAAAPARVWMPHARPAPRGAPHRAAKLGGRPPAPLTLLLVLAVLALGPSPSSSPPDAPAAAQQQRAAGGAPLPLPPPPRPPSRSSPRAARRWIMAAVPSNWGGLGPERSRLGRGTRGVEELGRGSGWMAPRSLVMWSGTWPPPFRRPRSRGRAPRPTRTRGEARGQVGW